MAMFGLIVLSFLFAATHIGMSHGNFRSNMIEKRGEMGFRAIYSAVSLITFVGALYLFTKLKGQGAPLWEAPGLSYLFGYPLMLTSFFLLFQVPANPSPAGMMPAGFEPKGTLAITRHPMNMGIAMFALAHIIGNGYLADMAFFGSLLVTGFVGAYHQDKRKAEELGKDFVRMQVTTSIFPFAAILSKRARFNSEDVNMPLAILACVAFAALVLGHGHLFGKTLW